MQSNLSHLDINEYEDLKSYIQRVLLASDHAHIKDGIKKAEL